MGVQQDIEQEEGFSPVVYKDSLGYDTIGHGICVDSQKGGITPEESSLIVAHRVGKIQQALAEELPWWGQLSQVRQDALVQMAYQLGLRGLLGFKRMLQAMAAGDWTAAASEALDSKWSSQTPARAKRVAGMIFNGVRK